MLFDNNFFLSNIKLWNRCYIHKLRKIIRIIQINVTHFRLFSMTNIKIFKSCKQFRRSHEKLFTKIHFASHVPHKFYGLNKGIIHSSFIPYFCNAYIKFSLVLLNELAIKTLARLFTNGQTKCFSWLQQLIDYIFEIGR